MIHHLVSREALAPYSLNLDITIDRDETIGTDNALHVLTTHISKEEA